MGFDPEISHILLSMSFAMLRGNGKTPVVAVKVTYFGDEMTMEGQTGYSWYPSSLTTEKTPQ